MVHDSTANVLIGLKERSDDAFCRISVRYDLLMHDADPLVGIVLLEELAVVVHVPSVGLELALTVEDGLPTADSRHQLSNPILRNGGAHLLSPPGSSP